VQARLRAEGVLSQLFDLAQRIYVVGADILKPFYTTESKKNEQVFQKMSVIEKVVDILNAPGFCSRPERRIQDKPPARDWEGFWRTPLYILFTITYSYTKCFCPAP
jgi:hypothetical protein